MGQQPRFVAVDPVTDQVLWVCSGANAEGHCQVAEEPPYICQGLRLQAAAGTDRDGHSLLVDEPRPGHCPALDIP
jgi:hypothetical protein